MNIWTVILLASLAVLVLKLLGYLVPPSFMERPTPSRVATLLTVALLAALLLVLRAPFIVVVLSAAVVAAVLRLLGWMA